MPLRRRCHTHQPQATITSVRAPLSTAKRTRTGRCCRHRNSRRYAKSSHQAAARSSIISSLTPNSLGSSGVTSSDSDSLKAWKVSKRTSSRMKSGRASMTCGPVPTCSEAANTIPKSPFLGLGPLVLEARVLRETPQGSYPQGGCGRSKDGFAGSDRVEVAESGLATHCAGLNHRGGCAGGDASLEVALVAGGLAPDSDPELQSEEPVLRSRPCPSLAKPGSGRVSTHIPAVGERRESILEL